MSDDETWEIRGRTRHGTRQAALDGVAALSVEADVVAQVRLEAVVVGEIPPGSVEFQGFRRWLRDRSRFFRARLASGMYKPDTAASLEAWAEECEAILKAVGDYWLGPDPC